MRWEQGRVTIDELIMRRHIQRISASREHAEAMIAEARRHLQSAAAVLPLDPTGAYALAYDAARKALAAILENQGLRATSQGGHIAVYEAVLAQLDPPLGRVVRPFNRIRIRRNEVEYPSGSSPALEREDVAEDLPKVREIVDLAERVIAQMQPY
jgi:hypothetical protein